MRKGTSSAYLVHPAEVGLYLQNLGMAHDTIIAGYLHDTLEDTKTTYDELVDTFGQKIADVVVELTCTNKSQALRKAHTYSPEAVKVKTADLHCNIGDIYDEYNHCGPTVFNKFASGKSVLVHYRKMVLILIEKTGKKMPVIEKELYKILTKIDLMS